MGRYENVGMKQTSCKASVTSDGSTSITLDIAKQGDAVEMSKTADDIPMNICFVLMSRGLLCTQGASLLLKTLVFMQSSFNMWCVTMT